MHILVVDDSALSRKMLSRLIMSIPSDFVYVVEEACSGEAALELITKRQLQQKQLHALCTTKGSPRSAGGTVSCTMQTPSGRQRYAAGDSTVASYFDVIFIDQHMDGISGAETIDMLNNGHIAHQLTTCTGSSDLALAEYHDGTVDSYVIGLTGSADDSDILAFSSSGANLVLAKPLDSKALVSALQQFEQWRRSNLSRKQ